MWIYFPLQVLSICDSFTSHHRITGNTEQELHHIFMTVLCYSAGWQKRYLWKTRGVINSVSSPGARCSSGISELPTVAAGRRSQGTEDSDVRYFFSSLSLLLSETGCRIVVCRSSSVTVTFLFLLMIAYLGANRIQIDINRDRCEEAEIFTNVGHVPFKSLPLSDTEDRELR